MVSGCSWRSSTLVGAMDGDTASEQGTTAGNAAVGAGSNEMSALAMGSADVMESAHVTSFARVCRRAAFMAMFNSPGVQPQRPRIKPSIVKSLVFVTNRRTDRSTCMNI